MITEETYLFILMGLSLIIQMISGFAYFIESGQDISKNSEKMNQIMKEINELLELIRELHQNEFTP